MKKLTCLLLLFPLTSIAQNTWNGSSISTYTLGNLGVGISPSSTIKLRIQNTGGFGFYNATSGTSTSSQYGIFNSLTGTGVSGVKYGIYNSVTGSSLTKFGIFTEVINTAGPAGVMDNPTAYAIYAKASGQNSRAAYFYGDVENYNSSNIFSSVNGCKTILFPHSGVSDKAFSIVMNTSDNQYDWAWGNGLTFFRSGLLLKKISNDDKAFSIERSGQGDVFRIYGDGKVFCTEINVKLASQFPDYVFSSDYKLMPASELRDFIKSNSRLPNMPSASEVAGNGLNVGETTRLLVEKIEELTLYMLQQQELLEEQAAEIKELQEKLK